MSAPRLILIALGFLALLGCSSNEELELPPGANSSEFELYQEAQKYLRNSNYDLAVQALQLLESRFPFGRYAEQAQLELVYAHYNNYEHEACIEAADRFIRLHPQHPNVLFAAGLSGHGFKLTPVLGEVLADLAVGRDVDHPIGFLSRKRLTRAFSNR